MNTHNARNFINRGVICLEFRWKSKSSSDLPVVRECINLHKAYASYNLIYAPGWHLCDWGTPGTQMICGILGDDSRTWWENRWMESRKYSMVDHIDIPVDYSLNQQHDFDLVDVTTAWCWL